MFHKILGFSYIYKTSGNNVRSCKNHIAVTLQGHNYDHNSVLRQMLTITEHDISNITHAKSVYENCSCVNTSCHLGILSIQFQYISGRKDEDILFRNSQIFHNMFLCSQMTVLAMDRDRIFRFHKGIDQLDFFLACMSGHMDILENNLGALHGQLIDNLGNCFFISGDRIGTEDDGIVRFDGDLLVDIGCHTGKCRHGLTLASGCDQNYLVIRIILHLIDLDQSILRNLQISKF